MTHIFDQATQSKAQDRDTWLKTPDPAYANMVGPFGGITAATVLRAINEHEDVQGQPLAFTLNYLAPISDDEMKLTVRLMRTNRTNQHWRFDITQGEDNFVAHGTAVYGLCRDTWNATEAVPPEASPAHTLERAVFPDMFEWSKRYDMRFSRGGLDLESPEAHEDSTSVLWLSDAPERPLDYASLLAMSDIFFPRVILRRGEFVPAGTVSLTTYFHASPEEIAAQGATPVLATARAKRFSYGHYDQFGELWGENDTLLATTGQVVYFK